MYRLRAIEQARIMNFELAEASELAVIYIRNGEEIAKHMRDDMYDGDLLENMGGMAYGSYLEVIFPNFMDWMEPYRRLFGK
jgi:hypothetical protein